MYNCEEFVLFSMQIYFFTEKEDGAISTLVLRGSTDNLMDDIERAVDDGVNTFKVLTRVSISSNLL
jgi:chaperonin GroEL (HSP60 family)